MPDVLVRREPGGVELRPGEWAERERLTDAVTRVATERGLGDVDPNRIAVAAGLSLDDFHRHFATADQCLLAAFDRFLDRMLEHIEEAYDGVEDWPEQVRTTVAAGFEFISEVEPVARLFAVDAVRTGPAGLEYKRGVIDQAARWLKHGRLLYPEAADLPETLEAVLVAGVISIVSVHLLGDNGKPLREIEPDVVELLLAPYVGADGARDLARSAGGRLSRFV